MQDIESRNKDGSVVVDGVEEPMTESSVNEAAERPTEEQQDRGSSPPVAAETEQADEREGADDVVEERSTEEVLREELDRVRQQMLRIAADFENFRKRSRRDSEEAVRRGREDLFRELLPVFDNLERASVHAEQASDANAVAEGVRLVLKQFADTIGKFGIVRVKSLGEAFDPTVHEAIQQIESTEYDAGTVAAELMSGYVWGERLVRAAMVVVAKARSTEDSGDQKSEEG